jgi:hypothetical protein
MIQPRSLTTENPIITNPESALSYWSAEAADKRQSRSKIQNLELSQSGSISVDQPTPLNPSRDLEAENNNTPPSSSLTAPVEKAKNAHRIAIADKKLNVGRYAIVIAGLIAVFVASYVNKSRINTSAGCTESVISM